MLITLSELYLFNNLKKDRLIYNTNVYPFLASGEEPCSTPKGRKDFGPGSAAPSPSPGAGSHSSAHDDYDASPSSWPRPPSSPVSSAATLLYVLTSSIVE